MASLRSVMDHAYRGMNESLAQERASRKEQEDRDLTKDQILSMIAKMIGSFEIDPADTDFQKGYLAALQDTEKAINANHYE